MEVSTFPGSPAEVGTAQGSHDPPYLQSRLKYLMELRSPDFDHPYFRKNMAFVRREFPDLMEQMEAFGEAAGIENFDHTYFLHIFSSGREKEACSALGILLGEDGPALLRTYDTSNPGHGDGPLHGRARYLKDLYIAVYPDRKPHGFVGVGDRCSITGHTSVNDAGLMLGFASGVPKFTWPDNPEYLNLFLLMDLLGQHCADCDDVRHFIEEYRISGIKGLTGTAVDANGNMLGLELESENTAFREPEDGIVLETNHWEHPDLQAKARVAVPDFWRSPGYYNSQNRHQYVAYYRETLKQMRAVDELIDFSFDVYAAGRLLQVEDYFSNRITCHALFMTSRDRKMRAYTYPLDKTVHTDVAFPD